MKNIFAKKLGKIHFLITIDTSDTSTKLYEMANCLNISPLLWAKIRDDIQKDWEWCVERRDREKKKGTFGAALAEIILHALVVFAAVCAIFLFAPYFISGKTLSGGDFAISLVVIWIVSLGGSTFYCTLWPFDKVKQEHEELLAELNQKIVIYEKAIYIANRKIAELTGGNNKSDEDNEKTSSPTTQTTSE